MPTVQCNQCNAVIPDPCQTTVVLFQLKQTILNTNTSGVPPDLNAVNSLLENQLGLEDHERHFSIFTSPATGRRITVASPKAFILRCVNGHRNHVTLTCP